MTKRVVALVALLREHTNELCRTANDRRRELELRVIDLEKRLAEIEAREPFPYQGVHEGARLYQRGMFVTWKGGIWYCRQSSRSDRVIKVLDVADADARDLYDCGLALIRPDQHVAWRGNAAPADPKSLLVRLVGVGR